MFSLELASTDCWPFINATAFLYTNHEMRLDCLAPPSPTFTLFIFYRFSMTLMVGGVADRLSMLASARTRFKDSQYSIRAVCIRNIVRRMMMISATNDRRSLSHTNASLSCCHRGTFSTNGHNKMTVKTEKTRHTARFFKN